MVLRRYISESKAVLFEGDNYSEEWHKEAAKRGLNNIKTTPEALDQYLTEKPTRSLWTIRSSRSVNCMPAMRWRWKPCQKDPDRSKGYSELVYNYIMPAAVAYQNELLDNITRLKLLVLPRPVTVHSWTWSTRSASTSTTCATAWN